MLLALILLTQLDGAPIWIESNSIQVIKPSLSDHKRQCGPGAGAVIRLGALGLCVRETPEQIQRKIEDAR